MTLDKDPPECPDCNMPMAACECKGICRLCGREFDDCECHEGCDHLGADCTVWYQKAKYP
jgi:hypothetical protein